MLAADGGDAAGAVEMQERAMHLVPERSRAFDGVAARPQRYRAATHPTARN